MPTTTVLTSKLARQYQQNTCLHRLHIICAHPSSFSMGTPHIGQHLIRSLSNEIPMVSACPSAANFFIFSSHEIRGCHCNSNYSVISLLLRGIRAGWVSFQDSTTTRPTTTIAQFGFALMCPSVHAIHILNWRQSNALLTNNTRSHRPCP